LQVGSIPTDSIMAYRDTFVSSEMEVYSFTNTVFSSPREKFMYYSR
jgi:hypothetical protein